uniref:GIPC GH2 domain-containing protein n=1 Tax=Timema genevievae TaxID=629358 RepID=A0A7R9PPM4_TIMGE|nr:unnamed protein product [Timema genevievae]
MESSQGNSFIFTYISKHDINAHVPLRLPSSKENPHLLKTSNFDNDDTQTVGIENINNLLESFMGINDAELATEIWELSTAKTNSMDFAEAIDNSELEEFGFTDDFIIELWGVITDARAGRLK